MSSVFDIISHAEEVSFHSVIKIGDGYIAEIDESKTFPLYAKPEDVSAWSHSLANRISKQVLAAMNDEIAKQRLNVSGVKTA